LAFEAFVDSAALFATSGLFGDCVFGFGVGESFDGPAVPGRGR